MNTQQYPEVAQAAQIAESSYEIALAYEIDSPELLQAASEELRSIATRRKEIEELRMSLTRPLDEAKRGIMDLFRRPTERLQEAENLLRKGVLTYQQRVREEQERIRREAEAKAADERAAAEQREREARVAVEKAHAVGDAAAAEAAAREVEEAREAVEEARVAPLPLRAEAPKTEGVAIRKIWKAEVEDLDKLIVAAAQPGGEYMRAFLMPNTKALGDAAKSMRGQARIPGVRIYADEGLSVRRAG